MTDLQARIMARLRICREVQTAQELAEAMREPHNAITDALHGLQDSHDALLRNGFYSASPLHWSRHGRQG